MKKIIVLFTISLVFIVASFSKQDVSAANREIIFSDNETYGTIAQSIGIEINSNIDNATVSSLKNLYGSQPLYLKITNPPQSIFSSSQFSELSQAGFKWYFLFTSNTNVTSFVNALYSGIAVPNAVIELDQVDVSMIQSLKSAHPDLKVHAGYLPIWPREQVKEILTSIQPPTIEGVSFWMDLHSDNTFADIKLTFDTFFDAVKDIAGGSIKINYPPNTILSVSEMKYTSYDQTRRSAYMAGAVSSSFVTNVQGAIAPIRYFFAGKENTLTQSEKSLIAHFSRFLSLSPQVVWPKAISANGDPWDNPYLSESNTKPIVGVIGKISQGFYGFITNAGGSVETANFGGRISFGSYKFFSTTKQQVQSGNDTLTLDPYETVVFFPSSLPDISGGAITPLPNTPTPTLSSQQTPTPTLPVGQPTPTPTSTNQQSCDQMKKQGNFNCTGGVDESDFTSWKQSMMMKTTSLSYFEYWRRVSL